MIMAIQMKNKTQEKNIKLIKNKTQSMKTKQNNQRNSIDPVRAVQPDSYTRATGWWSGGRNMSCIYLVT